MRPRTGTLLVLLRLAYIIGLALFLLAVVVSVVGSDFAVVGGAATVTLSPDSAFNIVIDWIAVAAFVFATIGAVLTAAITTHAARERAHGAEHQG